MSIGEIGGVVGNCEECRHTHGTSSCATCGGGIGNMGPPTLAPCRACLDGIAAASKSLDELAKIATDAGQSPEQAEATALQMLAGASWALPHSPEALAIAAGGDDADLILVDDEAPTEVLDRPEVESAAICAAAAEAIRQYEAGETLEWPDEPDANKMQAAVDDIDAGRVRPMADVIAQLAPIEETWRKTWTECADLLKAVAEKDPAAAAGYVARCREWLTRAVQYGS